MVRVQALENLQSYFSECMSWNAVYTLVKVFNASNSSTNIVFVSQLYICCKHLANFVRNLLIARAQFHVQGSSCFGHNPKLHYFHLLWVCCITIYITNVQQIEVMEFEPYHSSNDLNL